MTFPPSAGARAGTGSGRCTTTMNETNHGNPALPCRKFVNALLSFCAASLYAWAEFSPHHGATSSRMPAHW